MPSTAMLDAGTALHLLTRVLPHVPPPVAYRLCERAAVLAPWFPAWPAIKANMHHVCPTAGDAEVVALARGVTINLLKNYYDLLRAHTISAQQLDAMYQIEGLVNVQRALERGKGVLVVTIHSGNYSLVCEPVARVLGTEVLMVVEQMANGAVHMILNSLRRRGHVRVVPVGRTVTRQILQALRDGGVVILAQDRLIVAAHTTVDFFGTPVDLPVGPATLALRTGAPLVPAYVSRRPGNWSRVVLDPPIQPAHESTLPHAVHTTTGALVRVLEAYIRSDPTQWVLTNAVWGLP